MGQLLLTLVCFCRNVSKMSYVAKCFFVLQLEEDDITQLLVTRTDGNKAVTITLHLLLVF